MRFLSVCSGIEAASVAWEPLGWKAVGFSEIEPFPCAVLAHRFPNTPNYGSLTEYASWPIEPGSIDLLVGGTPCQSFSVAGLRKGMADPRGNLALVFLGLADRVKPRWIVWENVPGVLSSNGGRDFGSFLGALEQLGYGWAYRVLDAQHFGVPQRRRRVFVVACLGSGGWESAAKVLFEPESLSGDPAKGRKKGQGVASDAQGGAGASGCWWDGGQVSQTLDAVLAKGQTMPEKNRFPAVLQPFSHWEGSDIHPTLNQSAKGSGGVGASNQELFSQGGAYLVPGVPFRKSKRAASTTDDESWVEAGEANTLNNFDLGDTRTTHAVVSPHIVQASELRLRGQITPQDTCPTLLAQTKSGDNDPLAVHAIIFQPGNLRREAGADPSTTTTLNNFDLGDTRTTHAVVSPTITTCKGFRGGSSSEAIDEITAIHLAQASVAPTVTSSGPPYSRTGNERVEADALAITTIFSFDSLASNSMKSANPNSGCREVDLAKTIDTTNPCPSKNQGGLGILQTPPMAVRRLTPTECMRLQGFPDDWARIPWKGKPADQCPDGPQYKAAGNSMAVPVMRWIGSRIAAVEQLSNPQA